MGIELNLATFIVSEAVPRLNGSQPCGCGSVRREVRSARCPRVLLFDNFVKLSCVSGFASMYARVLFLLQFEASALMVDEQIQGAAIDAFDLDEDLFGDAGLSDDVAPSEEDGR